MNRAAHLAPILALSLLAASCTDDGTAPAAQGDAAAGEVLGGSISDAMIPLEQLDSQAPLAPRQDPAVGDIDGDQPQVTPVPGIEGSGSGEGAGATPAAPAPQTSGETPPAE